MQIDRKNTGGRGRETRVSATIVTYNNADKILSAVGTLLEHTRGVELTVYLSDNNSTDSTVRLVRQHYPQVVILQNGGNEGFGWGHNQVLDLLHSDYHAIVNPDIILDGDCISELCRYMNAHPDVGMITPKIRNLDGSEQHLPKLSPTLKYLCGGRYEDVAAFFKRWRTEYTMRDKQLTDPVDIEFCTGCFMLIRTELFRQIGGFDCRYFMYFEDVDLTREVLAQGQRVQFYPGCWVYHEWERAAAQNFKYLWIEVVSMCKFFDKWGRYRRGGKPKKPAKHAPPPQRI